MSVSPSQNGNDFSKAARIATRQRRLYTLWAVVFISLGLILLARNLGLLPGGVAAQVVSYWPLLAIGVGLFILLTGRIAIGLAPSAFAIDRGTYQEGYLQLDAGLADVQVGAFVGASQLAVGQFSGDVGPRLRVQGSRALLALDHRTVAPFMFGDWTISLVKGLPWVFTLRSNFGHFFLHLRDLTVTRLSLQSLAGDVEVTLPSLGQGEMYVRLTFGDLTLRVPEGMAVKIKLLAGPLTRATVMDRRLIQTAPKEWVTPNFSAAPQRFAVTLALVTGDLMVT